MACGLSRATIRGQTNSSIFAMVYTGIAVDLSALHLSYSSLGQSFILVIQGRARNAKHTTPSHGFGESSLNAAAMTVIDAVGGLGTALTTVCWLPQALQI